LGCDVAREAAPGRGHHVRPGDGQAGSAGAVAGARTKTEIQDEALRADLIELIETVIIYKLAGLSREEIQAMLQIHDLRETRVYQEARAEGRKEGRKEGVQKGIALAIKKMAAKRIPAKKIAAILEVEIALVHQVLKGRTNGSS
jgi:predicted transposase/invertase (TIGR01784 family)